MMKRLNALLLAIVGLATTAGCGGLNSAMKATKDMPAKMDQTLAEMNKTNSTMEELPVGVSLQNLDDPKNGVVLSPVPFDLLPSAQAFGKHASTDDIINIVYLWMQDLNLTNIADDAPADQIAAFNQRKLQRYTALAAICGLMPEEKVDQIIREQIVGAGRFETSAMQLLMLRVRFIRDVMLKNSLLAEALDNGGKLKEAIKYGNSIDKIARLPFASQISIDIIGFKPPLDEAQFKETLDPKKVALNVWRTLIRNDISPLPERTPANIPQVTGNAVQDKVLFEKDLAVRQQAIDTVNAKIKSWGGQ